MNATTADMGARARSALIMDRRSCAAKMLLGRLGRGFLLCATAIPTAAVVFISVLFEKLFLFLLGRFYARLRRL